MSDLDRQVAKALRWGKQTHTGDYYEGSEVYSPSTNWEQCGKLIEEYGINITLEKSRVPSERWGAYFSGRQYHRGATPQEAVCRAVIAMKEGET